ncbi:hypothetical protein J3F83DRAFT_333046 [Trichoderma novae-zelandiae]
MREHCLLACCVCLCVWTETIKLLLDEVLHVLLLYEYVLGDRHGEPRSDQTTQFNTTLNPRQDPPTLKSSRILGSRQQASA